MIAFATPTSLFLDVSYNERREIETDFNLPSSNPYLD
jgi:hypothetical protein